VSTHELDFGDGRRPIYFCGLCNAMSMEPCKMHLEEAWHMAPEPQVCYTGPMEPKDQYPRSLTLPDALTPQIGAVEAMVTAFQDRVQNSEINDLDDAEAFLTAWLSGMKSLQS